NPFANHRDRLPRLLRHRAGELLRSGQRNGDRSGAIERRLLQRPAGAPDRLSAAGDIVARATPRPRRSSAEARLERPEHRYRCQRHLRFAGDDAGQRRSRNRAGYAQWRARRHQGLRSASHRAPHAYGLLALGDVGRVFESGKARRAGIRRRAAGSGWRCSRRPGPSRSARRSTRWWSVRTSGPPSISRRDSVCERMRGGAPAILAILWAIAAAAAPLPSSPAWVSISSEDLQQNYDTLWAVSDVHGRRKQLEKLLVAAGIAVRSGGEMGWKPAQGRQLFIVVGDCIRGGPDSRGVVLLLKTLQEEAVAARSRVVVLLGNQEVRFLADPLRFAEDEFSRFIRTMPVAAVVGSWLFAHAGYIDAHDDADALRAYFVR